jgi:hypothetical membrane protein
MSKERPYFYPMINTRIYFGLVRFPIISISVFFICFLLAAFLFPGSEIEHIDFKSDMYSLSHNFLSGLGGLETSSGETNTASSIIFNASLVLVGATLVLFYMRFKDIFKATGDSEKSIKLARLTQPVGLVAGVLFAGVGFVPYDLHFGAHVFFANYAFLVLFILSILHSLTVYHSNFMSNRYALGYMLFCIVLLVYLYIIFLGPKISPDSNFSETDLMIQVISQKSIVFSLILSILIQVYGFDGLFKRLRTASVLPL